MFNLLLILALSYKFNKKCTFIPSSTNHLLTSVGYYDILIRGDELITANLHNKTLFIIIPPHPYISIEEILIDDYVIPELNGKIGFSLKGTKSAIIRVNSTNPNSVLQINAWLISNSYCSNSAVFAFGSKKMKLNYQLSIHDFCVFSPTLDSKNNEFEIHYGINNTEKQTYTTSLYKFDLESPLQNSKGNEIVDYESDGPCFVQFNFDENALNESIIFDRKTKTNNGNNKCSFGPFYRCSNVNNEITCNDDFVGDLFSHSCSGLTMSKTTLGLTIAGGCLGILCAIASIVLCSCCCRCCSCCCCNRNHESKKNTKQD